MKLKITLKQLNELNNEIDIIDKYNIKVNTKTGFKKIKAIGITSPNSEKNIIKTKDFHLSGSPNHRVKYNNEWHFLKNLNIGDYVDTIKGIQKITSIEIDTNKEDLWDIEVDGHEYFTNGILSHNSSLMESFELALYNKVVGKKSKWATLGSLVNRINQSDLEVKMKFKALSTDVEIIRGIKPNKLQLWENGIENTKAGNSNINDIIENYVGMDIETFKSFISMSINDFKNFISLTPAEKKMLLDKMFNLEVINILNDILKEIRKDNKKKMDILESEINTLDESISSIQNSIQRAIEKAKEKVKKDLESDISELKELMLSKKTEYDALKEKTELVIEKEDILKRELDSEKKQLYSTQNDIKNIQKEIDLYNLGKCPTCATDFNSDHFLDMKIQLEDKKKASELILEEIRNNIKNINAKETKLNDIKQKVNSAFSEIKILLRNYKSDMDKLVLESKREITEDTIDLDEFKESINELETKKTRSSIEKTELADKEIYYEELKKIFSEDGVKKSIIKSIITPLNHFIKENIKSMGLNFEIKLDDAFNANIKSLGNIVDHNTLSTGETKKINILILIAYLKMIRTKKFINILFLDEVFSSIDMDGIDSILTLLKSFANDYNINIFVVHHALLSREMFDRVIHIDKDIFSSIREG